MKHTLLFAFVSIPFVVGCSHPINKEEHQNNGDATPSFIPGKNVQTRNYLNIKSDNIHPEVDDGYIRISNVLINSEHFIDVAEDTTYLYKLSCKNETDSFGVHKIECDNDGFYYAELSEDQHNMVPNGFDILKIAIILVVQLKFL